MDGQSSLLTHGMGRRARAGRTSMYYCRSKSSRATTKSGSEFLDLTQRTQSSQRSRGIDSQSCRGVHGGLGVREFISGFCCGFAALSTNRANAALPSSRQHDPDSVGGRHRLAQCPASNLSICEWDGDLVSLGADRLQTDHRPASRCREGTITLPAPAQPSLHHARRPP